MGWFYCFKLHIIVNLLGEIVAAKVTPAHVDDRKPVPALVKDLEGKLYADKGYISKALVCDLFEKGAELITNVRKNMKAKILSAWDTTMLSRRFIIETINDPLKNVTQIQHSRHRSITGLMLNLIGCLVAYSLKDNNSGLRRADKEFNTMLA